MLCNSLIGTRTLRLLLVVGCCAVAGKAAPAQNVGIRLVNGTDGYVEFQHDPAMTPQTGITFEAWVTYDDSTLQSGYTWPTIVRHNVQPGQENYFLRVQAGQTANTVLNWTVVTSGGRASVDWTFAPGQLLAWTHVAGTYDGRDARLFVNGTEVGSASGSGTIRSSTGVLRIGKGDDAIPNGETWNGEIDEARLWPFARTAAEITSAMNLQIAGVPGLVSTWNLQNDFLDSSGALDGTGQGTVPFVQNTLPLLPFPISGAASFGASTRGCRRSIDATVSALPRLGNADFALICTKAAFNGNGALLTSLAPLQNPIRIVGVDIWPDPAAGGFVIATASDLFGVGRVPLSVPNQGGLAGGQLFTQFFWIDPCGPSGVTASDGLAVTLLR